MLRQAALFTHATHIFSMNNSARPSALADHPVCIELPIQWGDQDAFNHVNNVVYFRWMESARIEYFRQHKFGIMTNQGVGPILASINCDYLRQLAYPDVVLISASIASIGRTSIRMVHKIYSTVQEQVAAEGESVLVMFDYDKQRPILVADEIRARVTEIEGRARTQ